MCEEEDFMFPGIQIKGKYLLFVRYFQLKGTLFPLFFLSFIFIAGNGFAIVPKTGTAHKLFADSATGKVEFAIVSKSPYEMELLRHEVKEKRVEVVFTLVTIIGLSMFIGLLYIDRRRKKKMMGQQKYFAESQANLLKERLESTNKELTSKALYLATISDSKEKLAMTFEKIKPYLNEEGNKILQEAMKDFDFTIEHDAWDEFEIHFQKTHGSFYANLMKVHPDVTSVERRLCAFLKLNLETKEIAMIQNKSTRSIESSRYRLKKKLGLAENESLSKYLSNL